MFLINPFKINAHANTLDFIEMADMVIYDRNHIRTDILLKIKNACDDTVFA
jgi:hypothetical protein